MVTSIVLTGRYNIGISENNKIKTPDGSIVELKDIPFVRYRFDNYNQENLDFIKSNITRFPCVHIAEVTLTENSVEEIKKIKEVSNSIAIILYVNVTDKEVQSGFSEETIKLLDEVTNQDIEVDKICLKDCSSTLFPYAATQLKNTVSEATGVRTNELGVCGGPCCFIDGNACITAVKAREILSMYSDNDNVVVPSANHEGSLDKIKDLESCTNKCGCIRYHVFNHDTPAPTQKSSTKAAGTKKEKTENNQSEKAPKEKTVKQKGYMAIDW